MITSGRVILSPLPQAEHSGKPFGGIGEATGAGVGVIGASVVGTEGVPIGAQPQGATRIGSKGQKSGLMKPRRPAC